MDELIPEIMDKQQLASFMRISVPMVDKLRREKGLPYFNLGDKVVFMKEEVLKWMFKMRDEEAGK